MFAIPRWGPRWGRRGVWAALRLRIPSVAPHHALIALLVLGLAWLTVVPIARVFLASFTSTRSAFNGALTLDNYTRIFTDASTFISVPL